MQKFIQKIAGSLLLFTIVFLSGQSIQAQLKVGSNPGTLNAGAILEVESTNRGFLPPRVALASTTTFTLNGGALATSDGMMVYNTATAGTGATAVAPGFYIWQGGLTGSWRAVVASTTTTLGNVTSPAGKVTIGGTTTGSVLKDLTFNVNESLFDLSTMGAAGTFLPVTKLAVGSAIAGQVLTISGGVPAWVTPASVGINSLNGSTVVSQTFGIGTTGTAPGFSTVTATGVHTLNIPLASASNVTAGLLSNADYSSFSGKESALTFNNGLTRTGNTIALGGANPLLAATTINQATFNLTFSGTTGNTIFNSNNVGIGTATPANKLHVVGTDPLKLVGLVNITPVTTDSVLVFSGAGGVIKKASVNSLVGAGVTASNGITEVSGVIALGGALTNPTTITTTATNTLSLAGIQPKGAETAANALNDSLMVLTSTGRLVYRAASSVSPVSSVTSGNGLTLTSGVLALAPTTAADITSAANVTAGSTKVTLGGTPTGAALKAFSVDVNEANLNLANIGGTLPVTKLVTGTTGQVLQVVGTTPTWITPTAATLGGWGLTGNTIAASTPIANRSLGTVSNYSLPIITNNVERMRVDSLGNVGIGTVAPETRLHVVKNSSSPAVKFESIGTGTGAFPVVSVTANATGATLSDGFGPQFNLAIQKGTAAEINLARISAVRDGADNTGALSFATSIAGGLAERMRIDGKNGRVGIGTTNPLAKLHVKGAGVEGDSLLFLGSSGPFIFKQRGGGLDLTASTNGQFSISGGANNEMLKIDPSAVYVDFLASASRLRIDRGHYGSNTRLIVSSDTLELQTGGNSNQIALFPSGFVSIGTYGGSTTIKPIPTSTLDVNGSVSYSIAKITAATSLGTSHHTVLANASSAGFTITLPTASTVTGRVYVIRKTDDTSNVITFAETGNATTNIIKVTETSFINTLNYVKTLRIQSDGTNWQLID